jgi:hypothetical protein
MVQIGHECGVGSSRNRAMLLEQADQVVASARQGFHTQNMRPVAAFPEELSHKLGFRTPVVAAAD